MNRKKLKKVTLATLATLSTGQVIAQVTPVLAEQTKDKLNQASSEYEKAVQETIGAQNAVNLAKNTYDQATKLEKIKKEALEAAKKDKVSAEHDFSMADKANQEAHSGEARKKADAELELATDEANHAQDELNTKKERLNKAQKDYDDKKSATDKKVSEYKKAKTETATKVKEKAKLEKEVAASKAKWDQATKNKQTKTGELNTSKTELDEMEDSHFKSKAAKELEEIKNHVKTLRKKIHEKEEQVKQLKEKLEVAEDEFGTKEATETEKKEDLKDAKNVLDRAKEQQKKLQEAKNKAQADLKKAANDINQHNKEVDAAKQEVQKAEEELKNLNVDKMIAELKNALDRAKSQLDVAIANVAKGMVGFYETNKSTKALELIEKYKSVFGTIENNSLLSLDNAIDGVKGIIEMNKLRTTDSNFKGLKN